VAPAYSRLARCYDAALGLENLGHSRRIFESLVRRYGIPFRTAADVGCGTGLFARYLADRWGVPVFAVDRSPEMLEVARRHCHGPAVRVLEQDIRALGLPWPVDLITANFDVVNHLPDTADLWRTFRRIVANLLPGGHFIFDAITNCRPLGGPAVFTRRLRGPDGGLIQQIHWDPRRQRLLGFVVHSRGGDARSPLVERHVERGFAPALVARALENAGLIIRGVHDALTLRRVHHCPPRIVVVARRPDGATVRAPGAPPSTPRCGWWAAPG